MLFWGIYSREVNMPLKETLVYALSRQESDLSKIKELTANFKDEDWLEEDHYGRGYLHTAKDSSVDIFNFICQKCEKMIDAVYESGTFTTALMCVVDSSCANKKTKIQQLLKHGAKIEVYHDNQPVNPFGCYNITQGVITVPGIFEVFKILIERYRQEIDQIANQDIKHQAQIRFKEYLELAWVKALHDKQVDRVKYFLEEHQYEVNAPLHGITKKYKKFPEGKIALHLAAGESYDQDVLELLLANNADINASYQCALLKPLYGTLTITPLLDAVLHANNDAVERLLSFQGIDVNKGNPIYYASMSTNLKSVQLLLQASVVLDQKSGSQQRTPLEVIKYLITEYTGKSSRKKYLTNNATGGLTLIQLKENAAKLRIIKTEIEQSSRPQPRITSNPV